MCLIVTGKFSVAKVLPIIARPSFVYTAIWLALILTTASHYNLGHYVARAEQDIQLVTEIVGRYES